MSSLQVKFELQMKWISDSWMTKGLRFNVLITSIIRIGIVWHILIESINFQFNDRNDKQNNPNDKDHDQIDSHRKQKWSK